MANIKLTLSSKTFNETAEIYIRFYAGRGKDFRAHSHIYVPIKNWNEKLGILEFSRRFVSAETIALQETNKRLALLENEIYQAYTSDAGEKDSKWLQRVVDNFVNGTSVSKGKDVCSLFEEYAVSRDIAAGTIKQFQVLQHALNRFAKSNYTLYTQSITTKDIDKFATFLRQEGECQNTISSKLKKFRSLCRWACVRGYMIKNPFDGYVIPQETYGTPTWLTMQELETLAACKTLSAALSIQRDIFVFQCHIGCRVSDLFQLTKNSVTEDGFVQYVQTKLKKSNPITIRVPLDDTAKEIIERYKEISGDKLLPFISYDKYNHAIKLALRKAGITRVVMVMDKNTKQYVEKQICDIAASHLARRTLSANLYKATKDARIVSAFTGHSKNSSALSRYIEVDDDIKKDVIQTLIGSADNLPT